MNKFLFEIVDLTHTLDEKIPTWDGSCGFRHHMHHDYDPEANYKFRTHKIEMNDGCGTHMDAPAHCIPGGATVDELPLSALISPCAVIDISGSAHERSSLLRQDITAYEREHGPIEAGNFVMVRSGWERLWHTPEKYRNNHIFPSVSQEAAEVLLAKGVAGIGIDTLSPDRPEDGFPVHKLMLQAGKYIVENAANLAQMPARGSFVMVLPIKTRGATEAPIRLIGLINKKMPSP